MSGARDEPDAGQDLLIIDAQAEADEREEASSVARIGVYAVPVAVAHLALLYILLRAAFGFELPRFLRTDLVVAWLWVNGAAIGLGAWMWRNGRVPVGARRWVRGRRARWSILLWLGLSLAWFLLPALLRDAARAL